MTAENNCYKVEQSTNYEENGAYQESKACRRYAPVKYNTKSKPLTPSFHNHRIIPQAITYTLG